MPSSPCMQAGCPTVVPLGQSRCEEHRLEHNREIEQAINRVGKKVYNSKKWQRTRERQLFDEPLCAHCQEVGRERLAAEVDHIIPLPEGAAYDPSNLQSLCSSCHAKKTRREQMASA